jgi:O-antigen/teichoic acid export membrane protein
LPSIAKLGLVARKYFKLSAYGSATALALAFGSGLPSLLLAKAYSLEVAGLYLMAWRVFGLPAQMVGSAVSQVFIGEASRRFREDPQSVPGYFHSVHRNLIWVGVGVLCIGVISPSVMPWILGPKWNSAGTVIMILAPMAAMDITVTPMYNITVIGNRPKLQLFTGILPLGLSIAGLGIPILMGFSYKISIFCYSLCRCLGSGLIFITYRNIARTIGIRKIEPVNPSESNFNIDG